MKQANNTSWDPFAQWYDRLVGPQGHYYHEHLILPNLKRLLEFDAYREPNLIDLGCGQGVLARTLPPHVSYTGIDLAPTLIEKAREQNKRKEALFFVGDFTQPMGQKQGAFTHATFILSLQNAKAQDLAILEAAQLLKVGGTLIIVLNHPCFRIPRQSCWGVDEGRKIQYRRLDRYMTPLEIPIAMHPGQKAKTAQESSLSYHYPLSAYSAFLKEALCVIEVMEEWVSDKSSTGKSARMENRAREEFPLFLMLKARKI